METFQHEQRTLFRDWKLTPIQFFVLRIASKDFGADMSRLAEFLGVRPQTVTPVVDSLEEAGLIRRTRSPTDRRRALLEVTPKGLRMIETVRSSFFKRLEDALEEAPEKSLRTSVEVLEIATAALGRQVRKLKDETSSDHALAQRAPVERRR